MVQRRVTNTLGYDGIELTKVFGVAPETQRHIRQFVNKKFISTLQEVKMKVNPPEMLVVISHCTGVCNCVCPQL